MENPIEIAKKFNAEYEQYWNKSDLEKLADLYTNNAILVGYEIVENKENIVAALKAIFAQGWTKIKIETVKATLHKEFVVVANLYEASNPNDIETKPLKTKSSQVLVNVNCNWKTVMHSAF